MDDLHRRLALANASAIARSLCPIVEGEILLWEARETQVCFTLRCSARDLPALYLQRCITGFNYVSRY